MRKLTIFVALMVASLGAAAGPAWGPPGWQNAPLDPSYGPPGPTHPGRFWMVGTWNGSGSQSGTGSTWAMQLTVTEQGPGSYTYKIDYPSLGCGGYWSFNSGNANTGSFTEHIAYGREKCVDGGAITVGAMATQSGVIHQMMFRWQGTQPNGSTDYAQGNLTRS